MNLAALVDLAGGGNGFGLGTDRLQQGIPVTGRQRTALILQRGQHRLHGVDLLVEQPGEVAIGKQVSGHVGSCFQRGAGQPRSRSMRSSFAAMRAGSGR
jgi:hypothetical protein